MAASTVLQAANTLTGNGSTVDLGGAGRTVIVITSIAGTAGIYTFETSLDGGTNWGPAGNVRSAILADSSAVIAATTAAAPLYVYKIDQVNGPCLFRARISTSWVTNAPRVEAITVGI